MGPISCPVTSADIVGHASFELSGGGLIGQKGSPSLGALPSTAVAAAVGFELHAVLILKNLAVFRSSRTARSGQKPGWRNEVGTVNAQAKEA
jgi:hypothetical protein